MLLADHAALRAQYSVPILLISSTSATFFRLNFMLSTTVNVVMVVIFALLAILTNAYSSSGELVSTIILLGVGAVIFSAHSFNREYFIRRSFLAGRKLQHEERRSHDMLAKMLPEQIITKLKQGATFIYQSHPTMSVLFSHVHDFDDHAAALSAADLVSFLNMLFSEFDRLTDLHQVYKVMPSCIR